MIRRWAIICLFIVTASTAYAHDGMGMNAVVSCRYRAVSGGYRYYLTIRNGEAPATQAYVSSLDFMMTGMTDVTSPVHWSYAIDPGYYITWSTLPDSSNWTLGIPPSSNLSGFEFTYPSLKTKVEYHGVGYADTLFLTFSGYAVPQPVPEPSSLIVLLGGLGAVGLRRVKCRRAFQGR
jgi:hypothetical protein